MTPLITFPPLPPSSVPENIPEHLKLPPEWIDDHYYGYGDPIPAVAGAKCYQPSEEGCSILVRRTFPV